jgi:hypothetical protein
MGGITDMSIAVNHAVLAKGWERFTIMHKDRKEIQDL